MNFYPLATSTPKKKSAIFSLENPPNAPSKRHSTLRRRPQSAQELRTPPSSPSKRIPSLKNPPKAPKRDLKPPFRLWRLEAMRPFPIRSKEQKQQMLERLKREEREVYESWPIRRKYLAWTPLEVEYIDDSNLLQFLYEKYAYPSSQPQNMKEEAFFAIMKDTLLFKLASLRLNPQ